MISACLLHLMQTYVLQWLKKDFDSDLLLSKTATVKSNLKQLHKGRFNWLISEGHTVCLDSNIGATCRIAKLVRPQQDRYGELSSQGELQIISTVKSSATSGSFYNPISSSRGAMSHHSSHHHQENTYSLSTWELTYAGNSNAPTQCLRSWHLRQGPLRMDTGMLIGDPEMRQRLLE